MRPAGHRGPGAQWFANSWLASCRHGPVAGPVAVGGDRRYFAHRKLFHRRHPRRRRTLPDPPKSGTHCLAPISVRHDRGYPVAGSFSRSGVKLRSRCQNPGEFCDLRADHRHAMLFFYRRFVNLPNAAFAAIVVYRFSTWWICKAGDVTGQFTAKIAGPSGHRPSCAGLGVEMGLLLGVLLSIAFFLRNLSQPVITQIGRLGASATALPNAIRLPCTPMCWPCGWTKTYFSPTQRRLKSVLLAALCDAGEQPMSRWACGSVNLVDSTGLAMLARISQTLQTPTSPCT